MHSLGLIPLTCVPDEEMNQSFNTSGRLWVVTPRHFSRLAGEEITCLGVKAQAKSTRHKFPQHATFPTLLRSTPIAITQRL